VAKGNLSVSQARRVVPVITKENQQEWIEKAKKLSQRELEKQVAEVNPRAIVREKIRPVAKDLREMRVGISAEIEKMVNRVKDLVSQSEGKAASLEDVVRVMATSYLEKHDPIKKAERASSRKTRKVIAPKPGRQPIPAAVQHAVQLRDRGQCTLKVEGTRCSSTRWVHFHHVVPVARGGLNTVQNLRTVCSAHHHYLHRNTLVSKLTKNQSGATRGNR
jgi:5-methylcytosine-specific restriction endonuclease McrA